MAGSRPQPQDKAGQSAPEAQAAGGWPGLLRRAAVRRPGAVWKKEELLELIYWTRQALAVLAGVTWGFMALEGLVAVMGALALNFGAVYLWLQAQRIDEEDYGGTGTLLTEGFPPSFALFFLSWIATHSMV